VDSTESRYRTRSIGTDDDPTRVGGGICVFLSALLPFEISNFKSEIALLSPRFSIFLAADVFYNHPGIPGLWQQ
jgi:hypothetical protein